MENENCLHGNSQQETDLKNAMKAIKLLHECIFKVTQSERAIAVFLDCFHRGGARYDLPPAILETLLDCKDELEGASSELYTQMEVLSDVYGVYYDGNERF